MAQPWPGDSSERISDSNANEEETPLRRYNITCRLWTVNYFLLPLLHFRENLWTIRYVRGVLDRKCGNFIKWKFGFRLGNIKSLLKRKATLKLYFITEKRREAWRDTNVTLDSVEREE